MNSSTRLDSAVFQLTPTRTRCDLVIIVNGKKEKIASGLLDPFLSHLKAAKDQMAKGGYSIILEPDHDGASWFTRETIERFVRFVSTPEILERVYTIESEILQIEEAIAIQGNSTIGISTEENQVKHVESTEGSSERKTSKTLQDANDEKAIVLYKPEDQPPEANGTTQSEGNSKVQLLKVLETRKSVLQKEQGMAFARAVAAGFDIEYLPTLMSFAECFGAVRMMDACKKFMDLWRRKHESGQWLEIEASEAIRSRLDFAPVNTSGIILSSMAAASHTELDSENNGKANADVPPQPSAGHQENIQGQFPHHMYPPWPINSPPGTVPVFPPYPMQGMPYYQNYPGTPYMQPIYPPVEDPRLNSGQNMGRRRHSMDGRYSNTESEPWGELGMEGGGSQTGERRKKSSRSGRQKSGTVVIRNINYITKTENSSGSGSFSDSGSENNEDKDTHEYADNSKRRGSGKESFKKLNSSDREETELGNDADGGHWQAFQNCLLRDVDEDRHAVDQDQFEVEKGDRLRRKKHVSVSDPLVCSEQNGHEIQGGDSIDMHAISRGLTRMPKTSNDAFLLSRGATQPGDGVSLDDVQSSEIGGRRVGYRRTANDDFIILKQDSQSGNAHPSSDLEVVYGLGYSNNNLERNSLRDMNDDSYIVEYRSNQASYGGDNGRKAIDIDSELPAVHQKAERSSSDLRNHHNYEPDELSLMPERVTERASMGYDPALDYELEAQVEVDASRAKKNKEVSADTKPGSKRLDKEQKSKLTPNSSDRKKNVGPIRRGKNSKLSPLDEARARAEKLRNYKADLQKMKKEKQEEELKRLEALKMERQKRIASRSSSIPAQQSVPSPLTKKRLPTKLSPSSLKGSKFSDAEPGSSSPLQRFPVRISSVGSNDSKASKSSRLNAGSHSAENKLSRSVPSLPGSKQEKRGDTADTKASMARIRRLSEPKMSTIRQNSTVKPQSTATMSKTKVADGAESKKISAIVNHDKNKTATLPEVKVRTAKATDVSHNRSSVKEKTEKVNGNKISTNLEGALPKKSVNTDSSHDNEDDNPIIEKTVVVLESEKPSDPAIHMTEEKVGGRVPEKQCDNCEVTEKTEAVSNYVAIRAPVSPSMDLVNREITQNQAQLQPISSEVKSDGVKKGPSNIGIDKETYHAPFARVSSMEDPCQGNSEYGKAPSTNTEIAPFVMETVRAHVADSRNSTLEKIPEVVEKPQVKESSKGFRRLLKFGRKNHSSATSGHNTESDNASIDGSEADEIGTNGSSKEAYTLKNLISQDETSAANTTPQKSSRTFSLLSPFRSKSSEKKVMMA
ncbi:COP1-interacting protein 7 isoform X2 [Neltuma alba]|uniref:COP1-interacting protein 7 isoform X2 n=1 Tax=Neltuma alba TaxID=207710 RepID=UPI0010A39E4F|nr:COP1-interacting protein 7-like isoform X2 [Prosopis alba]XP_028794190.1 COP1-interacting protein 7-like isoform X2 [Prosopis alba]